MSNTIRRHRSGALRRVPIVLVTLALLAGPGLLTAAFGRPPGGGPNPMARLERAVERLDLDADTEDAIGEILAEAKSTGEELRDQIRGAHDAQREILQAESPDEAEAMAQAEVIGALQTERHKHELTVLFDIRELLTAEQLEALQDAMSPPRDRRSNRPRNR